MMNGKQKMKVFMTGATGYVARVTLPRLFEDDEISEARGIDVRAPEMEHPKFSFIKGDVLISDLEEAMAGCDVAAHMAFIVTEIKDKKKIYDINVRGTRRTLDAVKASGIRRLVVASSICAYGSWPSRGVLTEESPLRGNAESYYSHTKRIVEKMLDEFEKENPEIAVTRLRPSILCGAGNDNFFVSLISKDAIFYPSCNKTGLPLVHEDDVGRAFYMAIKSGPRGAFNIAAGNMSFERMGQIIGKKAIGLPFFLVKPLSDIGYLLGILPISSHWIVLSRYPFNLSCDKAKKELGWEPIHTPEEAFREMAVALKMC